MIVFPNAKINLGLNIVRRRPDGYHDISTLFYPIELCDLLEVTFHETRCDEAYSLKTTGIPVGAAPGQNILDKVMSALLAVRPLPHVDIHLHKQIPHGAGLGGGSSDASFLLKTLNDLLSLGLSEDEMCAMMAKIGADCPFFIRNRPALAEGIGDVLRPIELDLSDYSIRVEKPDVSVPTKEAYAGVKPKEPEVSIEEIVGRPVEEWRGLLVNDFEESVFALHPEIGALKESMYGEGAVYASMSGSGSAVFGIFKK